MDNKTRNSKPKKVYYMTVPPGTPFSIMVEAAKESNLTIEELEIAAPPVDDAVYERPKALVLKGFKGDLLKAKKLIGEKLEKRIRQLSKDR